MIEQLERIGPDGVYTKSGKFFSNEENTVLVVPKQFKVGGWIMWFQAAFATLAKDRRIDGNARRVLDMLMAQMDWENWIGVNVTALGKELEMQKSNVSRSLKQLVEAGVLERGEKIGRCPTYKLNHHYAWKGKAKARNEEILKQYRTTQEPDLTPKAKKPRKTKSPKLKLVKQEDGKL